MKFTSEDLLKAMGLKLNDKINFNGSIGKVYNDDVFGISILYKNQVLKIESLFGIDYEIIQPKPTLTEDEKVILKNVPKEYKYVMRDSYRKGGNLVLSKGFPERNWVIIGGDGYWLDDRKQFPCTMLGLFNHLFQFIKWEDEPYSIEELLGDS